MRASVYAIHSPSSDQATDCAPSDQFEAPPPGGVASFATFARMRPPVPSAFATHISNPQV